MDEHILIDITLILLFTKVFGLVTKKLHLPQVVGALIAGIILGPSVLGLIKFTDNIQLLAEIGVIILLFNAGLETDLKAMQKAIKSTLIIGVLEVTVCLILGTILAQFFGIIALQAVFIGVILTATSLGISVQALQEMGKLKTKVGTTILGVAVVDDILGIIILTVVMNLSTSEVFSPVVALKVLGQIGLFFVFALICGFIAVRIFKKLHEMSGNAHRITILALAFCFAMAFTAEKFGLADITGAYIAGLILSRLKVGSYIEHKTNVLSYLLFSPIFFASIGIKTQLQGISVSVLIFALALIIFALISKLLGNYIGARLCKYSHNDAVSVGMGMISRGEVTLIMADKGTSLKLLNPMYFPAVILMVIITTLITPILLALSFKSGGKNQGDTPEENEEPTWDINNVLRHRQDEFDI